MRSLLFLVPLLFAVGGYAQSSYIMVHDDAVHDNWNCATASDGNFIYSFTGDKMIKLDAFGNVLYSRYYSDGAQRMKVQGDKLLFVNPNGQVCLYDTAGVRLFVTNHGADWFEDADFTSDGNIIASGLGFNTSFDPLEVPVLTKLDLGGDTLWSVAYDVVFYRGYSVVELLDGGYVMLANAIIKTDPNGNALWKRNLADPNFDFVPTATATPDSGFIAYGVWGASTAIVALKFDKNGMVEWSKRYSTNKWSWQQGQIINCSSGGFLISGSLVLDSLSYYIRIDAFGDTIWTRKYQWNSNPELVNNIVETADGGFLMGAGVHDPATGLYNKAILVKMDSSGLVNSCIDKYLGAADIVPLVAPDSTIAATIAEEPFVYATWGEWQYPDMINLTDSTRNPCIIDDVAEINRQEFRLYPNPTNSHLYVECSKNGRYSYFVTNLFGEMVLHPGEFNAASNRLEVGDLKAGVYFIHLIGKREQQCYSFIVLD